MQLIQLTGGTGNYAYYSPLAQIYPLASGKVNETWLLGEYTRAQRDEILRLAKETKFVKTSIVNGCRVWTRDLLQEMAKANLLSQETFDKIDKEVPLVVRQAET
jgi:hypothetical protein